MFHKNEIEKIIHILNDHSALRSLLKETPPPTEILYNAMDEGAERALILETSKDQVTDPITAFLLLHATDSLFWEEWEDFRGYPESEWIHFSRYLLKELESAEWKELAEDKVRSITDGILNIILERIHEERNGPSLSIPYLEEHYVNQRGVFINRQMLEEEKIWQPGEFRGAIALADQWNDEVFFGESGGCFWWFSRGTGA